MKIPLSLQGLLSDAGRRDPYSVYAELHRHGPMGRLDPARDKYDFVVHGYEAAHQVLRDPAFRIADAEFMDEGRTPWRGRPVLRTLFSSFLFMNGPDHARMRSMFGRVFTPRRVTALTPAVARLIEVQLDRMAQHGAGGAPVDFMSEFALPLPSDVIGELLGVPEEDRPWFPPRVRAIGAILELGIVWTRLKAADTAALELSAYFAELVEKRRAQPRDDMVSGLVQAQAEEPDQLSDDELLANLIIMFNAGFVTTTHLFGNGLTLLLDRPALIAELLADPGLVPGCVVEILRYEPSVHVAIRRADRDTEVVGERIPAGSRVLVLLGAANRDPHRFADPDVFDPRRQDNQPLSFGAGPHYCLGAALSRVEGELGLPMLFRRFPRLALAGPPGEPTQLVLRGYTSLPVTVS